MLVSDELALARRWGDPHAIGTSLRVLALVEGGKEGIALLREAVEVLEGSEAQLEYAHALVDLGAALRRANQRSRHASGSGKASTSRAAWAHSGWPSARTKKSPLRGQGRGGPADRARRIDGERAARRPAGGRGHEQQGDCANTLRHDQDGGGALEPRLPQARDQLPQAARRGPTDSSTEPYAGFRISRSRVVVGACSPPLPLPAEASAGRRYAAPACARSGPRHRGGGVACVVAEVARLPPEGTLDAVRGGRCGRRAPR